jgi:TrmH family RNA methyltransferase
LLINSPQNKRVKNVIALHHRRRRDSQRLMVIEGVREARVALQNHVIPREAYVCPAIADQAEITDVLARLSQLVKDQQTTLLEVTPPVFAKIAYRSDSGGILLVAPYLNQELANVPIRQPSFLVVIEDVEKPGNLGAILRTADAAGTDGVIIGTHLVGEGGGTDIHNPNVIRASLGALFTVPVAAAPTRQVIDWLRAHGVAIVTATPSATALYTSIDLKKPIALVLGSEARGLSEEWLSAADEQVMIPMKGVVDSLNLAVSTALLLYEVVRQRSGPGADRLTTEGIAEDRR